MLLQFSKEEKAEGGLGQFLFLGPLVPEDYFLLFYRVQHNPIIIFVFLYIFWFTVIPFHNGSLIQFIQRLQTSKYLQRLTLILLPVKSDSSDHWPKTNVCLRRMISFWQEFLYSSTCWDIPKKKERYRSDGHAHHKEVIECS